MVLELESRGIPFRTQDIHKTNEGIALVTTWRDALSLVNEAGRKTGLKYAIVGSLGVAATCGSEWKSVNQETQKERDLDVFVLGNSSDRELFHTEVTRGWNGSMPEVDSNMAFGHHITVENGVSRVSYKGKTMVMDKAVLEPIWRKVDDLQIPVLHPVLHVELLRIYNRKLSPKILDRMNTLKKFIEKGCPGFEKLSSNSMTPLHKLRRTFEAEYLAGKTQRYVAEMKSKNEIVEKMVDTVHKKMPKLWGKLHEMSSKE